ncbi:MAG TPA: PIN domain-containing protein [Thermoanaerobaculia bacterium]|nr:PIN domain-containing protein [Thermoanaerobaculia bacterium]
MVPVTRGVLVAAAKLRADSRMKLPDAIHAVTGILEDCTLLLTNDDRFGNPPGLQVVPLEKLQ